jgi:hypothetical protein
MWDKAQTVATNLSTLYPYVHHFDLVLLYQGYTQRSDELKDIRKFTAQRDKMDHKGSTLHRVAHQ